MAIGIPPLNKWSGKHIVVAAAIGTLVVIAITAIIIISLTPPQVLFSIEDPRLENGAFIQQRFYNFTLSANNTSRRMKVLYSTLNTEIWISPTQWYSVEENMSGFQQGYVQPPGNVTKVPAWAEYYQLDSSTASAQGSDTGSTWPNCTVAVIAKVLFKVGLARTRPYHINVTCFPVNFVDANQTPYTNCI